MTDEQPAKKKFWTPVNIAAVAVTIVVVIGYAVLSRPTQLPPCRAAFATAEAIDPMRDTVSDLDPAVRACVTVADWKAAAERYPGATNGADPLVFLANRCKGEPSLRSQSACLEALAGQ